MSMPNDIFNNGKGKLPEEKLMAYLEGRLSPEEQHEVEAWLAEEGMESDAVEGLQELPANETRQLVNRLNLSLDKQLRPAERRHKQITENKWAWLAVVIILLLCVLGYWVIRMVKKKTDTPVIPTIDTIVRAASYSVPDTQEEKLIKFEPKYDFKDFAVTEIYNGKNAAVDLKTNPTARRYRTAIKWACDTFGVNFAGHYCIARWGCGTSCQESVIVDMKTGKVYNGLNASMDYEHYKDSRMLIVNPPSETYDAKTGYYYADCDYCIPQIWVWNEMLKKFEQKQ